MKVPLNTLLLGGCMVHWPLLRTGVAEGKLDCGRFGPVREAHTFGEMFQLVDVLRGERRVPRRLRHLAHLPQKVRPVRAAKEDFSDLDLMLLAPSSPIELVFRGVSVNRAAVTRLVSATAAANENEQAEKLLGRWMRVGLLNLNESVRSEASAELVECIRGDSEDCNLSRALVSEVRTFASDVFGGFRRVREMFSCPIGVVLYVFRYMPDGRPISWPAGFREEVLSAAEQLELPVFDPAPHVLRYGVEAALMSGHSHYSKEFLPVIGKAIMDFAESVHADLQH